jgi:hypothetical protein
MAARGKFDEGIPLLRRAIDRTANPPGWYFHLVAIDEFLRGDYPAMLATARRSAVDGSGFSQGLIAIAAGAIGDRPATAAALQKMGANSLFAADPAAFFRRHGVTEETAAALLAGLAHARQLESRS